MLFPYHLPPSSRPDLTEHQIRLVSGTSGHLWTDLGFIPSSWLAAGCSSTACLSNDKQALQLRPARLAPGWQAVLDAAVPGNPARSWET